VTLAQDGTLSADGVPITRIGLWQATDPNSLLHQSGTLYSAPAGVEPVEEAILFQGYLEESNVNPVVEIARMIEVQRAYEIGQRLLDRDDERVRSVIQTLGR
jgi:flagellar basal-body rod protein FlgF